MNNGSVQHVLLNQAKDVWREISKGSIMPIFSYEWYKTWISINHNEGEPYILLIKNKTIAPFVRRGNAIGFAHKFTDFNDLIGRKDTWPIIMDYLKENGIKNIEFENIRETSETVKFFTEMASLHPTFFAVTPAKTSPFLILPATFDEYLTTIREKRKKYNKFMREYPEVEMRESDSIEKDMGVLIHLMKLNPTKKASFTPQKEAFFKSIALACRENIQLILLYIKDNPIGVQLVFTHGKTIMIYIGGYDISYPNTGTFLMMSLVKQAIERGFKEYNFLIGREAYKYELGAKDFKLYSVSVRL